MAAGARSSAGHSVAPAAAQLTAAADNPRALAVDQDSPVYNEGAAAVALLRPVLGTRSHARVRRAQPRVSPREYGRLVAEGTPSLDAWQDVFEDQNISRELERYVSQDVMTGLPFRFTRPHSPVRSASSKVSAADAQALLGDLLRRAATSQETVAQFDKAIVLQPPSARARALYGLFSSTATSQPRLSPCCSKRSKDIERLAGPVSRRDWHRATRNDQRRCRARAHCAGARGAERVLTAKPDLANALALEARLDTAEDSNPGRAPGCASAARARFHRDARTTFFSSRSS